MAQSPTDGKALTCFEIGTVDCELFPIPSGIICFIWWRSLFP